MGLVRGVVLPSLRLLVWAVIAVALCVLAFGGDGADTAGTAVVEPSAGLGMQTVSVQPTDIASRIEVTGTVSADPAATVRSTAAGVVTRLHRAVGDTVGPGTPLLDVRVDLEPVEGAATTGPDGAVVQTPPRPRTRTVTVTAGSDGVVASIAVLKDQDVSVGTDVATISPGTLSVAAPLTQSQQFRLLAPPASAQAQARGGPAPFDCVGLTTGAAAAPGTGPGGGPPIDPMTGQLLEPSTAQVTCRVPPGTTVFAGMSVDLTIDTGSAQQVLAVPVSAVLGSVAQGTVWVVGPDGVPVERPVQLGLTDGERVQVTQGLVAGDEVLEFAPVDDAPVDDASGAPGPA